MRDVLRSGWVAAMAVCLVALGMTPLTARAEDNTQAQVNVKPAGQATGYQPIQVPSSNIIGYKPIPNSALEAAMNGTVAAPAQAVPAYPVSAPGGAIPMGVGSGTSPAAAGAPGQLPVTYQFGIVGEGFYTLGRDDVIQIDVRNQPEFSGVFAVGFDGRIQYNYLGDIPVAGLTKFELQQVLEKLLVKYVRVPLVVPVCGVFRRYEE